MDSSRSGLLSTLLMTLPLIVVPAVALLRPPGQVGVVTTDLAASDADENDALFEGFPEFDPDHAPPSSDDHSEHSDHGSSDHDDSGSKPEDDIFEDMKTRDAARPKAGSTHTSRPGDKINDPFLSEGGPQVPPPMKQQAADPEPPTGTNSDLVQPEAGEIVVQLNSMGALKTVWFEAGEKTPVGLAVFFRGPEELTRFRFEAVGDSRDACARDVLEQVTRWQQQNPKQ